MRIAISLLFSGLLILIPQSPSFSVGEDQKPWIAELEHLAKLSEEEIDIGSVSLLLAKEVFPDLDIKHYSKQLDQMAEEIRKLTNGSTDPDYRIRAINTYLYQEQGFHYDKGDPYGKKLKNRFLSGILDTKSGSCTTMPLLYLVLAQRLGYPIYPVSAPQHLFLRYASQELHEQNIEATSGGAYARDEDYIRDMEIPEKGIETGAYLQTMTYREFLGDLIVENGTYWARKKSLVRAIDYFKIALTLNPKSAEVCRLLGHAYHELSEGYRNWEIGVYNTSNEKIDRTLEITRDLYRRYSRNYHEKAEIAMGKASALGVAPPLEKNYWLLQQMRALSAEKL